MTTKEAFNAACKRLHDADHELGKIIHQILQARTRAYECVQKSRTLSLLSPDASLAEHDTAAAAAAQDYAQNEGARRYWAQSHQRLMEQVLPARRAAADAEKQVESVSRAFWSERWTQQRAAFLSKHKAELADLFGALKRSVGRSFDGAEFFEAIAKGLDDSDTAAYRDGARATEKVIPSALPLAVNLSSEERSQASYNAQDIKTSQVGPVVSKETIQRIREDMAGLVSHCQNNEKRLLEAEERLRSATLNLNAANSENRDARLETLRKSEASVAQFRGYVESGKVSFTEKEAAIRAAELELAKLDAVAIK